MLNLRLLIKADGRYKFDRKRVRRAVGDLLTEHGMGGKIVLSLAIVGDRKMEELHKKYMGKEGTTDVLSFVQGEDLGGEESLLGDVVVSYRQAKKQALEYYKSLDEEIEFLVCHGVLHLLGIHHE